jgi:hypothetical protein
MFLVIYLNYLWKNQSFQSFALKDLSQVKRMYDKYIRTKYISLTINNIPKRISGIAVLIDSAYG